MTFSISSTSTPPSASPFFHSKNPFPSFPIWVSCRNQGKSSASVLFPLCFAAKSQTGGPVKKRSSSAAGNKKRRKGKSGNDDDNLKGLSLRDVEIVEDDDDVVVDEGSSSSSSSTSTTSRRSLAYYPSPLPKPPAGFVVDDTGRVLMASNKRIATVVDSVNNSLECVIRRVFQSSRGEECMLLCPVDTPVQILKSTNMDGWAAVSDEDVEAILPTAVYALAKIHMHLVHSGFCYTARGGFCYSEDDIFDFRTDDGQDIDGLPTEGIEITCFHLDGSHYMIYTPSDPLLFVAVKDHNGLLQIADDDLLEDPAIMSAIDEETEFNALVEEEAALLESLLGER
ncbi:uncharacterized protein LOC120195465 [Hibiscus syriacus]|uniref:uncharacterized protein LOC120195465 n=1 Tax=Hibiscus syriacus TaxID=106335 RepID=UPI001921CC97|nr:uncharacterized protein LOC120195465 [Hibiscus syriacus]